MQYVQQAISGGEADGVNPSLQYAMSDGDILTIALSGAWKLGTTNPDIQPVLSFITQRKCKQVQFYSKELGSWDTSLLSVVFRIALEAQTNGIAFDSTGLPDGVQRLLALAQAVPPRKEAHKSNQSESILSRIGGIALDIPKNLWDMLSILGDVTLSFGRYITGRSACRTSDIFLHMQECGIEALPIVSLISILVGFILAFVGVMQLRMFGAEIYVSSLVAVGMTRIMGAVMTGIIMSGRTGASYAAVIGTMQVNEEIDALTTQGINPTDFLILPRLIALSLMTPLLVLYSDFMGIIGGFFVGVGVLGLDPDAYMNFTKLGFSLNNVWVGVAHGFVFGIVVSIIGCFQGLRCGRSASAVGQATTSAVVLSIVGIVISTSILTLLCNFLHI